MGSATESNARPQGILIPMAENDRKTFKKLLKVFFKKDKKKDKANEVAEKVNEVAEVIEKEKPTSVAELAIENVLQNIEKLKIKDNDEFQNFSITTVDIKTVEKPQDEFDNFTFKTIKDEGRNDRSDSHSSEDSGFAEKLDEEQASDGEDDRREKDDEIIEALENLAIDKQDGKSTDRRVQTVVVARTPIRQKVATYKTAPYYVQTDPCRQIQVNKHTLTGGQVIVNRSTDFLEVDAALKQVQQISQHSQHENQDEWFSIITEVIQEDSAEKAAETVEDFLSDFFQSQEVQQDLYHAEITSPPHQQQMTTDVHQQSNPIDEFSNSLNCELFGEIDLVTSLTEFVDSSYRNPNPQFVFPTPPHSENAASPMSDTQSYRTTDTNSPQFAALSPERSSPIYNSDYEKFQEIPHFDRSPVSVSHEDEKKREERNSSTSSMTMKQYKDLQKEISHSFSKMECCQLSRRSCRELFQEYLKKMPADERGNVCLKVAKMDLEHAYGVLQNVLRSLSQSSEQEDLHHVLFCLICERVLRQTPAWYVDDFGLNLLKSAALRCPNRPLLTRYLVQCVRAALKVDPSLIRGKDSVFHEVDAQGDTLLIACARRGDACADALAELVRRAPNDLPLFRIHHLNSDGASALHVACGEHGARSPCLHVVHVLLEHGGADLWQGDAKAGDTAVHVAVNSRTCDLRLVMVLFKHEDRKVWKKLAHAPNMCSTTPLEYARSATKSQVRDGYPAEVLEFLKKCR